MEAVKVTSAEWLMNNLGPMVDSLAKSLKIPGIHGPSLFSYFAWVAQYGGDQNEIWVVMNDDGEPVALAQWNALMLPHVSKVYIGYMYTKDHRLEVPRLLVSEFMKFGDRCGATWFVWEFLSERLYKLVERILRDFDHKIMKTNLINSMSWKV